MQIRHNLVVTEKPFFRRGRCVLKAAYHLRVTKHRGYIRVSWMKLLRLGSALAGAAACAVTCALLWPHARYAAAVLSAQNDPAELSDIRLNAVMQNDNAVISRNIEAALVANDADLAHSFVELAEAKN